VIDMNSPRLETPSTAGLRAFTLVELLVVIVILTILGSLSLAGLNVGRQRAKQDRTASTIRKLNEVIEPMYEDFATRSTPDAILPQLMCYEMPDQWADVQIGSVVTSGTFPSELKTGAVMRFARIAGTAAQRTSLGATLSNAECLWLCVARSGFQPDAVEQFRPDELTDLDNDGAKEFADGWGKPIYFLRWAPGFATPLSAIQTSAIISQAKALRPTSPPSPGKSWRASLSLLTPLVYSAGPDEATNDSLSGPDGYGLQRPGGARTAPFDPFATDGFPDTGAPRTEPQNATAYRDNITNHDLIAR
jgi:prepilin-type N-terminal cleavage/methylation domain-containing protein